MPTSRLTITGDIGGVTVNSTVTRSADGQISHDVSLPAATAGTVSSYTAGPPEQWTLNLPGHALALNDIVDVYWDAGRRYGMKVVGVVGDDVTVEDGSAAAGDSIPTTSGYAVTASRQTTIDTDFDGDLLVAIGALAAARAHLGFFDTTGVLALSLDLGATELWHWLSGGTASNPLAGKVIDYVVATQADSNVAANLKLGLIYDSTV